MKRWENRVAVVTGASSGIGEAVARNLVEAGMRVVTLARRANRLEENRLKLSEDLQKNLFTRKCDISVEREVREAFQWIDEKLGGTDILVNNAGVNTIGKLVEMDYSIMEQVLSVNVRGLIWCTQAAFKSMKKRQVEGYIVNVNSIAGHAVPRDFEMNIYPATKFAVTAINETIRHELRNLGMKIRTTSISPGLVRTEIAPKEVIDAMGPSLDAKDVADAILYVISTPLHVEITELTIKPRGETV